MYIDRESPGSFKPPFLQKSKERGTYLDLKLEVLVLPLPAEHIAWNTNFNWVLQVVWICSQRARNHPLSKAHQMGRTKRNPDHSSAKTMFGQAGENVFQAKKRASN